MPRPWARELGGGPPGSPPLQGTQPSNPDQACEAEARAPACGGEAASPVCLSSWLRPEGAVLWGPSSSPSSLFRRQLSFCLPLTAQPIFNFQHWRRGARAQALVFPLSFFLCLGSSGPPTRVPAFSAVPAALLSCPLSLSLPPDSVLLLSYPHRCCWLLGPPFPPGLLLEGEQFFDSARACRSHAGPLVANVVALLGQQPTR